MSMCREVLRLALPAIAHMLLITLVFAADRALVGRYATPALASLHISTTIMWTVCAVFTSFSAATLALVARCFGAGDARGAATAAKLSLALALAVGVVVTLPIRIANGHLLGALFPHTDPAILAQASAYLHIVLPVLPLAFFGTVAAACLQALGDTRTPLWAAAIAIVVNLLLSAVLVFGLLGGPALGVVGAAIGSAVALALQAILLGAALLSERCPLTLRAGLPSGYGERRDELRTALRRLLRIAWPAVLEKMSYHGGYLVFVAVVGLLGSATMAAHQALLSIEAVSCQTAEGFGVAAAALVAQRLGAGKKQAAGQLSLISALMAVSALSLLGLGFVLAPRLWMAIFSSDPTVVRLGLQTLPMAALAQPFMALAVVAAATLRGAGDTRSVLWVTLLCSVGVRLLACWLFALELRMGIAGVWLASALDWMVQSIALGAVLLRGRWRQQVV